MLWVRPDSLAVEELNGEVSHTAEMETPASKTFNSLVCHQAEAQPQRDQRCSELISTTSMLLTRQKEAAPLAGQYVSACFVSAP